MSVRQRACLAFVLLTAAAVSAVHGAAAVAVQGVPDRLSDQEFWRLSSDLSEPNGFFQSDNLVSNERLLQWVVPVLTKQRGRGAYLGVAPDQNFTFIATSGGYYKVVTRNNVAQAWDVAGVSTADGGRYRPTRLRSCSSILTSTRSPTTRRCLSLAMPESSAWLYGS